MLAGLPGTPNESSEHKERLAALLPITAASVLANARLLRKPKARTVRQRFNGFGIRTGSSTGTGGDLSAVPVAHAECVPCEADMRREPSRPLSSYFRKS